VHLIESCRNTGWFDQMNIATPAEAVAMIWTSSDLIAYHHPAFRSTLREIE
jgi:hypothetical protein